MAAGEERRAGVNHDEIRAALATATPGPWQVYESMQADTFVYGPRGILRDDIIAGPTYNRENAHLIAHAPEWLADLLGEVDLLRTLKHRHEQTITELAARAEAAEQAVQRVRELHTPEVAYDSEHHDCEPSECDRAGEGEPYERCAHCSGFAWEQLWPCSTIRALDGGAS